MKIDRSRWQKVAAQLRRQPVVSARSAVARAPVAPDRFVSQTRRSTSASVALGTDVPQGPVFDGSRPAPGVINPDAWITATPTVTGDPSRRTRAIYDNVINQFAVANNPRYTPREGNTYCNIFASDVMQAMGAPLPHWVDDAGNPTPDLVGRELDANDTNRWLNEHGPRHGWRKVSAEEAQSMANQGHPVVASWLNPNGIGHIGVVRPGEIGNGPALAQAGSTNTNSAHVYDFFPVEGTEYWVHDGGTAVVDPNERPIPTVAGTSTSSPGTAGAAASTPSAQPSFARTGGASAPAPSSARSGAAPGASAPSSTPAPSSSPARPSLPPAGLDLTRYSSELELLLQRLLAEGLITPEDAAAIRSAAGPLSDELAQKLKGAVGKYQTEVLGMSAPTGAWDAATVEAAQKKMAGALIGAPAVPTGESFGDAQLDDATAAINASAARWGVPPNFLKTIIAQESSGDWKKNNYTHSLRGDTMYPYIGMFSRTARSRAPDVDFAALAGDRDGQIDLLARSLRSMYDQLQKMDPSYGWDNVASYHYSGKPVPNGWVDERGVSNDSYYNQTLKFWAFLEPGFDRDARPAA